METVFAEDPVTICLELILKLTGECRQAIADQDPARLLESLNARQQPMDQIDQLQPGQKNWTEPQLQLLQTIKELENSIRPEAQALLDNCRQNLLGIRNQRKILAYANEHDNTRHYLDTRE